MYWVGLGVPQDCQEGVKWFRRAAEQGDARAQSVLGRMYYESVPEDYQEELKRFRRAAEQETPRPNPPSISCTAGVRVFPRTTRKR